MDNLDLNIDNYSLEDLFSLFNISFNFNKYDLVRCKKMVLKTHPDKSKLDKKYFLFFKHAYAILFEIYNSKNSNFRICFF